MAKIGSSLIFETNLKIFQLVENHSQIKRRRIFSDISITIIQKMANARCFVTKL